MIKKPEIKIEFSDALETNEKRWLNLLRKNAKITFPDGESGEMIIDMVERNNNNASAIVPFYYENYEYYIYLRSCIRPAVYYKGGDEGIMWEIPAGVIDPGEEPEEAAARELMEEMGFDLSVNEMQSLGPYYYSSVGIHGEKIYLYAAEVNPKYKKEPTLDGSLLEKHGKIICISLREAKEMIENGEIRDSKTMIGISRLESGKIYIDGKY